MQFQIERVAASWLVVIVGVGIRRKTKLGE
jgi:hypothetical protein